MKHRQGFTLIEVLVAATIISVLTLIGMVSYGQINKRSRDVKRKSDLEQVRSALEMYRSDHGVYPYASSFIPLSDLGTTLVPAYMQVLPADPQSPNAYYYSGIIPVGTLYYSYCICGRVEITANASNNCGEGVDLPTACTSCGEGLPNTCGYALRNP